jgi:hypothetical protein
LVPRGRVVSGDDASGGNAAVNSSGGGKADVGEGSAHPRAVTGRVSDKMGFPCRLSRALDGRKENMIIKKRKRRCCVFILISCHEKKDAETGFLQMMLT